MTNGAENKPQQQISIDEIRLELLILAKLISDRSDRKDQLDQIVRVMDQLMALAAAGRTTGVVNG